MTSEEAKLLWVNPEYRKKQSESHKGNTGYWKGKTRSENTKEKLSRANKEKHIPDEVRKKISNTLKGKQFSEETRRKISESKKGQIISETQKNQISEKVKKLWEDPEFKTKMCKAFKTRNYSNMEEIRSKSSEHWKGDKNPQWKGGITPESRKQRWIYGLQLWRKACLIKYNFTCQRCGQNGGKLAVHHINNFAEFSELRTAIDNGIVLCKHCHDEFHRRYKRNNNTREQLEEFLNDV